MNAKVFLTCPACGHEFSSFEEIKHPIGLPLLRFCDPDTGGCDRPFLVDFRVEVFARVWPIQPAGNLIAVSQPKKGKTPPVVP